jgi:hypothetical protein
VWRGEQDGISSDRLNSYVSKEFFFFLYNEIGLYMK